MKNIYLGNLCNNNCKYCNTPRGISYLPFEEIKKQIDSSNKILFFGGEPTIRRDFLEVIEYAKNKRVKLLTNGRMFSYKGFCKKVIPYIDEFQIKLPSLNEGTFKELTGTDALDETLKGINNLLELNANIRIIVPLTKQNYEELYELTHKLFHLGVKNIDFELTNTKGENVLPFISQSTFRLKEIIDEFGSININIKNIPKCLFEFYPNLAENEKDKRKSKASHCAICLENKKCNGIWQNYIDTHGGFELKPFSDRKKCILSIPSAPKFTIVELTKRCNLDCTMCYYRKSKNEKDFIETEDLIRFVTQLKELGAEVLSLTGGEPFLRGDLPNIIKHASDIGLKTTIFTNAQLIDKALAKKIVDSGLSYLFCSLDALTPELNDKIRGKKGVFERTLKAIEILNDARKGSNLKLGIGTVIMGVNLKEIKGLTRFSKEKLNVDHISYKPVQAHKLVIWNNKFIMVPRDDVDLGELWITPQQYSLLDSTIEWIVAYKRKNKFIFDTEDYLLKLKQYYRTPYNSCLGINCDTCEYTCIIDCNGNLIPCWGIFTPHGNIKQNAKEIWNSEKHKKMKEFEQFCELPCHNVLCNTLKRANLYKNYSL
jgi:MoaA/NifB/PqqE/SkfB family radical SAM enzyme